MALPQARQIYFKGRKLVMLRTEKLFMRKLYPYLIIILLISFVFIPVALAQQDKKSTQLVGGACKYKSYPGQATILSIARSSAGDQSKSKRFEIKFSFLPKSNISESFAQVEGKTFVLYDNNFQYPDKDFLSKNNLQVGKTLDGNLQAITQGTCTPVLFDFATLK